MPVSHLGYLRFLGSTDSLTVVLGFRFAVDSLTNRPVFAERCRFPDPLPLRPLAIVIFPSLISVRGAGALAA